MTDYTPTTEQIRDAYVRGMRDTFIASAGEHREEFERWVQAHDDEVRASVQPPTREQIAEILTSWFPEYEGVGSVIDDTTRNLLALFPQPTPSLRLDVAEQTAITRRIDEKFMQEGGTTRHWVQALNRAGYVIAPATQPTRTAEPTVQVPQWSLEDLAAGRTSGRDEARTLLAQQSSPAEPSSIADMAEDVNHDRTIE